MRLYRIEGSGGRGPYGMNFCLKKDITLDELYSHQDWDSHPTPIKDFGEHHDYEENSQELHYAFLSYQDLKDWFNLNLRINLRKYGYRIKIIDIDGRKVQKGKSGRQVRFRRYG